MVRTLCNTKTEFIIFDIFVLYKTKETTVFTRPQDMYWVLQIAISIIFQFCYMDNSVLSI